MFNHHATFTSEHWLLTRSKVSILKTIISLILFEMNLQPFKEPFSDKGKIRKSSLLFSVLHPTAVTMCGFWSWPNVFSCLKFFRFPEWNFFTAYFWPLSSLRKTYLCKRWPYIIIIILFHRYCFLTLCYPPRIRINALQNTKMLCNVDKTYLVRAP